MELYNAQNLPLSDDPEKRKIQEKMLRGEKLTAFESVKISLRDHVIRKIGDYECKPDHCYRAISEEDLRIYKEQGFVGDKNKGDYIKGENNKGIDWYLGGACPGRRYGEIVIECPAYKDYFQVAGDNGLNMANDLNVRHIKSSSYSNPITMDMITNIFDYKKIMQDQREKFDMLRQQEMVRMSQLRQQQLSAMRQQETISEENIAGKTR